MNTYMNIPKLHQIAALCWVALLALGPAHLYGASKATTPEPADVKALSSEESQRLTAARRIAADDPEVSTAYEQAKADKAAARKAYLDYKSTRERAASSENAWRSLSEKALAKADPAAEALVAKEKAAFRARMAASRPEAKAGKRPAVKVAEDDGDDAGSEEDSI